MRILLNGAEAEATAVTLEAVLAEFGYGSVAIATALNGDFVPRGARPHTPVTEGDAIEVLAPLEGG